MGTFYNKLGSGEIRFRDNWQFELKTEFPSLPDLKGYLHSQEFYIFIPNSLQVNYRTYTKAQFYRDQTNFIRFKTPELSFKELIDPNNHDSPLVILHQLEDAIQSKEIIVTVQDQLKLFGNIVRSALRDRVREFVDDVRSLEFDVEKFVENVSVFAQDLKTLRSVFSDIQSIFHKKWSDVVLRKHFSYVDEFISISTNYYVTGLIEILKKYDLPALQSAREKLCDIGVGENVYRKEKYSEPQKLGDDIAGDEFLLYRNGLLNRFVTGGLRLMTHRSSIDQRFRNLVGSIAAGLAMMIYLLLFIWQGGVFAMNSEPFIITTVILYILKDRIKEGLKTISFSTASRYFPDYTTEIRTSDGQRVLGKLKETFSFIDGDKLPEDVVRARNKEFHTMLETFRRPERVIYYKKSVNINRKHNVGKFWNYYGLNIIFRFNISRFLTKASNPVQTYITLNPETREFIRMKLPKVYHINIIMKNTYIKKGQEAKVELKKFRLIVDKKGIKRVEHIE